MLFSKYVRILQNHYKESIGDAELCSILFDFVIMTAELTNSKDPSSFITISPSTISKILAGNAPIHKQIRDHIYDDKVVSNLVNNFSESIVPCLNPELNDLCFQMMQIIESDIISPEHKAEFELLAKPETIAPFLAKAFIYAIVTNSPSSKFSKEQMISQEEISIKESALSIKGIAENKRLSDFAIEELFLSRIDISRKNNI